MPPLPVPTDLSGWSPPQIIFGSHSQSLEIGNNLNNIFGGHLNTWASLFNDNSVANDLSNVTVVNDVCGELAETEESSIDEFHLFNSPYSNVVGKKLRDQCNKENYGISIARDQVNNRAFVHDMKGGSSARKMFSTDRAASSVKGAIIISVNGKPTFTVEDVLVALRTAKSNKVRTLDIEFTLEKRLSARDQRKVNQEHSQFTPETMRDHFVNVVDVGDYDDIHNIPSIMISDLRDIASIRYPDLDFSEESIPTEIIEVAINAIRSDVTTPEEQSIGHFTRRKLKESSLTSLIVKSFMANPCTSRLGRFYFAHLAVLN